MDKEKKQPTRRVHRERKGQKIKSKNYFSPDAVYCARDLRINISLHQHEHDALIERAGDYALAGWLRSLGLNQPLVRRNYISADPALIRDLAKIGNNLNQIARRSNSNQIEHVELLLRISEIQKDIHELASSFKHPLIKNLGDS